MHFILSYYIPLYDYFSIISIISPVFPMTSASHSHATLILSLNSLVFLQRSHLFSGHGEGRGWSTARPAWHPDGQKGKMGCVLKMGSSRCWVFLYGTETIRNCSISAYCISSWVAWTVDVFHMLAGALSGHTPPCGSGAISEPPRLVLQLIILMDSILKRYGAGRCWVCM